MDDFDELVGLLLVAGGFVAALAHVPARRSHGSRQFSRQVELPTAKMTSAVGPNLSLPTEAPATLSDVSASLGRPLSASTGQSRVGRKVELDAYDSEAHDRNDGYPQARANDGGRTDQGEVLGQSSNAGVGR